MVNCGDDGDDLYADEDDDEDDDPVPEDSGVPAPATDAAVEAAAASAMRRATLSTEADIATAQQIDVAMWMQDMAEKANDAQNILIGIQRSMAVFCQAHPRYGKLVDWKRTSTVCRDRITRSGMGGKKKSALPKFAGHACDACHTMERPCIRKPGKLVCNRCKGEGRVHLLTRSG